MKSLGLVAVAAFGLCVVFLVLAFSFADNRFNFARGLIGEKPIVIAGDAREWAWSGGDKIEVDLPASIVLEKGAPPRVIVHGPSQALKTILFGSGKLAFAEGARDHFIDNDNLVVTLRGITLRRIDLNGAGRIALGHVEQDKLAIHVSGAASVSGEGHVGDLDLEVSGAGASRLAKLAADRVHVDISGAGSADIAPRDEADVSISGVGRVHLATKPKHLVTHVSGIGKVTDASGARVRAVAGDDDSDDDDGDDRSAPAH